MIVSLVRSLSDKAKAVPLALPSLPFASKYEVTLLLAVHSHLVSEALLEGPAKAWDLFVSTKRTEFEEVGPSLRFGSWCRGLGRSPSTVSAVAFAGGIVDALSSSEDRQTLERALDGCRKQSMSFASVTATYKEDPARYDDVLALALNLPQKSSLAAATDVLEQQHGEIRYESQNHDVSPVEQIPEVQSLKTASADAARKVEASVDAKPDSVINSGVPGDNDGEELSVMQIGEIDSSASNFILPEPAPAAFTRLVQGPVPGLTKSPQSAAELLQAFSMPKPVAHSNPRWIPAGEAVTIQGFTIERGMVYCGPQKEFGHMRGVIHPQQSVRRSSAKNPFRPHDYVGGYESLSPEERYRFLAWLADGAKDTTQPSAALLYFYGLERRLLRETIVPSADGAQVLQEVQRLASIFTVGWTHVGIFARRLADFIAARKLGDAPASELPPIRERSYELPLILRHGLGCFARDNAPVPVAWMLRWVYQEPHLFLRTPATRCVEEFERAFAHRYREKYGEGLTIAPGKQMLKTSYTGLDYGLRGPATEWMFAGIPDIADAPAALASLKELVEESTADVEAYSRFCGRNPGKEKELYAYFTLPRHLRPASATQQLEALGSSVAEKPTAMLCEELLSWFGIDATTVSIRFADLARGLEQNSIGMEPDVLAGAKRPKLTDSVVLFPLNDPASHDRSSAAYLKASLAVALAACVATADDHADEAERDSAERLISRWTHLQPDLHTRLKAQYQMQVSRTSGLTAFRTRLLALEEGDRLEIARDMVNIAVADGTIAPAEVKLLESLYRMLGLEMQTLYSYLYVGGGSAQVAGAGVTASKPASIAELDQTRIAKLRQESEQASAMLYEVFLQEEEKSLESVVLSAATVRDSVPSSSTEILPGLDSGHRAFLASILTQPEWSREDLLVLSRRSNLMLDGALEQINDAAFEHFGAAMMEGDDPVFVQLDLLESA